MAFSIGLSAYTGIKQAQENEGITKVTAALVHANNAPVTEQSKAPRMAVGAVDIAFGITALVIGVLMTTGILHLPIPQGVSTGLIFGGGVSIGLALHSIAIATASRDQNIVES